MKRRLQQPQRILALLVALFLGIGTTFAYDFSAVCETGQTLYYRIIDATNHEVELTFPSDYWTLPWSGYDQPEGPITLSSVVSYDGVSYTVKAIGSYAFSGCSSLTGSLVIPNTVATIGVEAFKSAGFTGTLTIPNSVITIGASAFIYCSGFTGALVIPNSVTKISSSAFYGCSGFTGSLTLPNSLTTIDASAFYNCSGLTGSLVIPNSVTLLGRNAFNGCSGFTGSLTIPNTLTEIPYYAFCNCGFTGDLLIPNSVVTIDHGAFSNCSGFTSLTLGNSVTTIGDNAFSYCTGLTGTLSLPNTLVSMGNAAFKYCNFTGSLTIPNSVTSIGSQAFESCEGFNGTLTLGQSLTTIGNRAFYGCNSLTGTLTIPNSVTTIGLSAFSSCYHFTGPLTIPNSVTEIGSSAFFGCTRFNGALTIGSSVATIGEQAFYNCSHLTEIIALPLTPPVLGSSTFQAISTSIPVDVPCASLEDYQAAEVWSAFTNMQCRHTVTVTAIPAEGGTVTGGGKYVDGELCTVTATPNTGYLFLHWSENGTVVSCNPSYTFSVNDNVNLEAVFMSASYLGTVIGEATGSNTQLPSHSFYRYSLTEQIYTASEMGGSRTITTISFFNEGATKTRIYDIYMCHTSKINFSDAADWIAVTSSDKVFSGSVTMKAGYWTTIVLDTPFNYNGSSNLLLLMDDNSNSFTNAPHMACRTFTVADSQAIRVFADGTNFNPLNLNSYSGVILRQKNQIMLDRPGGLSINVTSANSSQGTVSGGGQFGLGDMCSLMASPTLGYMFLDWTDEDGTVVSTEANYSFVVKGNKTLIANFIPEGDYCYLAFDLHDDYGDGWNGNYLTMDFNNGMVRRLTVPVNESEFSLSLPFEKGSRVELGWILGSWPGECSFEVRYADCTDGNLVFWSRGVSLDEDFTYVFDVNCDEMLADWIFIGDGGIEQNVSLPSHSYYNYSMSQQIYTADEIGRAGSIKNIAFYNQATENRTRTYDIYLKPTDKAEFNTSSEAVAVSDDDKVFSGEVTLYSDQWTVITFDVPFNYDGLSNVVLVVDDNTNAYDQPPYMACRVFETSKTQSIRAYSDEMDYNPTVAMYYSYDILYAKNQVYFGFMRTREQTIALAAGANYVSFNVETTLVDLQTALTDALGTTGVTMSIKSQTEYTELKRGKWTTGFNNFDVAEMFIIKVSSPCEITLTGAPINPAEHPVTITHGANWIAYPLSQPMTITNVFTGFVGANDALTSQTQYSKYTRGKWSTEIMLQPGQGYIYGSAATGDRTFIFPISK